MTENVEPPRDYYYDDEVAEKLRIPLSSLGRLRLPNGLVDGKRVYPKELIDKIVRSWSDILGHIQDFEEQYRILGLEEKYYDLGEFADAIGRDPNEFLDESVEFYEQRWIPEEEAEEIIADIASRQPSRDANIRSRLSNPNTDQGY